MLSESPDGRGIAPARTGVDLFALTTLFVLLLFLFWDVLVDPGAVYSHWRGDTYRYFVHYRRFGFERLAAGDVPLWNPHTFAGGPFVGGFQSALFYPLNLVYLLLPLGTALDLEAFFACVLMAFFTYAWARNAEQTPLGGFLAAVTATLGATFWLRIMAGMETVTSTLAWTPLLFLATDRALARPGLGPFLLATLGFAMQLLAGYPTYAALTVFALGIYVLCRLPGASHRVGTLVTLSAAGLLGLALAAIQIGPGLETTSESVRNLGMGFRFASSFPMPPENFALFFFPGLYGDVLSTPYWAQSFFWDANPYIGIGSLILAIVGLAHGPRSHVWPALVLVLLFGVASVGRALPVYSFLYHWVPLFQLVRAPSKLVFFTCFPLALIAGFGADALAGGRLGRRWLVLPVGFALLIGALALFLDSEAGSGLWRSLLWEAFVSGDAWYVVCDEHRAAATRLAFSSALEAGIVAGGISLAWLAPARMAGRLVVAIATLQLVLFAQSYRGGFELASLERPVIEAAVREAGASEERLFDPGADLARNLVMSLGGAAIWGYEPVALGRYARFMRIASDFNLDEVYLTALRPMRIGPLGALLRLGTTIHGPKPHVREKPFAHLQTEYDPPLSAERIPDPMGRFEFFTDWKLTDFYDWERVRADLLGLPFRRQVLLEESPGFAADPGGVVRGAARILEESNDEMVFEVEVDRPAVLVITDAYSQRWRAEPVGPASTQEEYRVLPADLTLRGIPLEAGAHTIRLYYDSPGLRWGALVTGISLLGYLTLLGFWWRRRA